MYFFQWYSFYSSLYNIDFFQKLPEHEHTKNLLITHKKPSNDYIPIIIMYYIPNMFALYIENGLIFYDLIQTPSILINTKEIFN